LALSFFASLSVGSAKADIFGAFSDLFSGNFESPDFRILFYVRLPRVLGALLSGAALAASGAIIQAVLNNAMAAPNIIGVNSGAGFFAVLLIAAFPSAVGFVPIAAFFGALGACLLIYAIASKTGADKMTVTLVGIAVGSILGAGINTLKTLFPDSVYDADSFMIGGLSGVGFSKLALAAIIIFAGLILACVFARGLDVLSLGDESARSLGMNVRCARFLFLTLAAALAGAAVSFAGLLGFVGLLVPHIMRRLVGADHRALVPASVLGGALLVLLCDLVSRTLFAPYELPVGILLSLLGGPFFIILVLARRNGDFYD
jgi:iron complex transport system permease protein